MTVLTVDIPFVRAIDWSPETPLTTDPQFDYNPSIMQTGDGTIWVVWVSNRKAGNYELFYKTSSNYGLTWSPDTRLTTASGVDLSPSIMQARNGTIWVVWASDRFINYELFYKTSHNNGAQWSQDTRLTIDPNFDSSPSIMQVTDGTIWVVWCSNRTGNYQLFYKTYTGSAWSTEEKQIPITNPGYDLYPSIMQARNGTIWVVWSSYRTGNYDIFYKTFNGTVWSSDTQLTSDPDCDEVPSIAQDVYGNIWVVWESDRATNAKDDIYYKVYNGSVWSPADPAAGTQLTSDSETDWTSSIAQINNGKIWVVWASDRCDSFNTYDFEIYYKTAQVKITGDVNGDRTVNASDLSAFSQAYGSKLGDINWNPNGANCDFNEDTKVDAYDLFDLGKNYGKSL